MARMCSACGGMMIIRTSRRGKHIGSKFYGCKNFPRCRHTEAYTDLGSSENRGENSEIVRDSNLSELVDDLTKEYKKPTYIPHYGMVSQRTNSLSEFGGALCFFGGFGFIVFWMLQVDLLSSVGFFAVIVGGIMQIFGALTSHR